MLTISTHPTPPRRIGGGLDDPTPRPRPPAPSRVRTPPRPIPAPEPEPPATATPPPAPEPVAEVIELHPHPVDPRAELAATIAGLDDTLIPAVADLIASVIGGPGRRTCPLPSPEEADWTANRPRVLAPFHCRHCGRPFHVRRHLEAHEDAAGGLGVAA